MVTADRRRTKKAGARPAFLQARGVLSCDDDAP
jgi:hypothetical protein